MSEPNEYLIVKNLQAALQSMTVAGGYYYNLGTLETKLDPDIQVEALVPPDAPRPFVLLDVQPHTFVIGGSRPNYADITMPINVFWVNNSDATDDDDWTRVFFRGCRDVEKAIACDIGRGDMAFDTRVISCQASKTRGAEVWAAVTAQIRFQRTYGA